MAASDPADTNSSLDYTEEDVLAVITVSSVLGIHMKLEGWVDGGLHGVPPEIASEELDLDNASALYPEHSPVLELMHSLDVSSAGAWEALQPTMELLEEEIGIALMYNFCGKVLAELQSLVVTPLY